MEFIALGLFGLSSSSASGFRWLRPVWEENMSAGSSRGWSRCGKLGMAFATVFPEASMKGAAVRFETATPAASLELDEMRLRHWPVQEAYVWVWSFLPEQRDLISQQ